MSMLDFNDRRSLTDRRQTQSAPIAGRCRRRGDRRNHLRQYEPAPWWLQTDYVEEIEPPQLEQLSAAVIEAGSIEPATIDPLEHRANADPQRK